MSGRKNRSIRALLQGPAGEYYPLFNLLCFKLFWLALVLFQDRGLVPALVLFLLMLFYNPERKRACRRMAGIAAAGLAIDATLSLSGVFIFPASSLLPLWLVLLWLGFALSLPYGFAFLARFGPALQALAGIGASFSYLAGMSLGAVDYGLSVPATQLLLAGIWAVLLPLVYACLRAGGGVSHARA